VGGLDCVNWMTGLKCVGLSSSFSSVTFFLSILHFAVFSAAAVFSAISSGSGGGQVRIGQWRARAFGSDTFGVILTPDRQSGKRRGPFCGGVRKSRAYDTPINQKAATGGRDPQGTYFLDVGGKIQIESRALFPHARVPGGRDRRHWCYPNSWSSRWRG